MKILERYFEALRTQDWDALGSCLADDVHRTGPYLDVVQGRQAYVKFLSGVIPTLPSYKLQVHRILRIKATARDVLRIRALSLARFWVTST